MEYTIAIDGPAGSGKSTAARQLARKLGFKYLDTGAMYRAVTYKALQEGIDLNDKNEIIKIAKNIDFDFISAGKNQKTRLLIDDEDVTEKIRLPQVNNNVAEVSKIKGVRQTLIKKQRKIASKGSVIMDGRDIGSVVLPDADFKFYITASLEERARRRYQEMQKKNEDISFQDVKKSMKKRDKVDSSRQYSPLIKAEDALEIDSTDLSPAEVLEKLINIIKKEK